MSIRFVWREMIWQEEWGLYRGRKKTGNVIVDGGVLSNFPIRLIAEASLEFMGAAGPAGAFPLGMLLDDTLAPPGTSGATQAPKMGQIRTVQRVLRLIDTMMQAQDNDEIRRHADEICRLPVEGYGTTEFDIPDDRLEKLIDGGHAAMTAYLAQREPNLP